MEFLFSSYRRQHAWRKFKCYCCRLERWRNWFVDKLCVHRSSLYTFYLYGCGQLNSSNGKHACGHLSRGLGHVNSRWCHELHVVACHRFVGHYGGNSNRESDNDYHLHGNGHRRMQSVHRHNHCYGKPYPQCEHISGHSGYLFGHIHQFDREWGNHI